MLILGSCVFAVILGYAYLFALKHMATIIVELVLFLVTCGLFAMDVTYGFKLDEQFVKALATIRTNQFSKLTQKQAEAVVAMLQKRESHVVGNKFGWSFARETDELTKLLPFYIGAFNAIDRDVDEVVSRAEFNSWLIDPKIEHRLEGVRWSSTTIGSVDESQPAYCQKALEDGMPSVMKRIYNMHFSGLGRQTMNLRDFVQHLMTVLVQDGQARAEQNAGLQSSGP